MKLKYDAFSYVLENGTPFHKLKLLLTLNLQPEKRRKLVRELKSLQSPDGGWNWFGDLPSNPAQTVDCIEQLVKCGVNVL